MKIKTITGSAAVGLIALLLMFSKGCGGEIDDQKPVIDLSVEEAFPVNCDTITLGQSFTFWMFFTDNAELGSYSIEIHHNFDHHAHSTEVEECQLSPVKQPVNPLYFLEDYTIPAGTKEYLVTKEITLPASNGEGVFDQGDYHFFVRLTDREGWSTQKGLSIKILN
jgi:hypothetical protein